MMTIKQIYELAVSLGITNDLRGSVVVKKRLKKERDRYHKLTGEEKKRYDQAQLENPYSDTRYFAKDPSKKVSRILVGIDMETPELLLAKELSQKKPIDLVLAHHPIGPALAGLHEVMHLQAEILANYGVPINVAQSLNKIRLAEVSRTIAPVNHNRVLAAAELLGLDMMCTHTVTDNMVAKFLEKELKKNSKRIETVKDLMDLLKTIPEYQEAIKHKAGPMLFAGSENNFTGKIALTEVTGGTSGSKDMYEKMSLAGVGTIVGMHMHEEYKKEAEKHHINIIIAGHMSSDSIGMNLFLDELEKRGIEIIPCSGLIRIKRFRKRRKKTAKKKK